MFKEKKIKTQARDYHRLKHQMFVLCQVLVVICRFRNLFQFLVLSDLFSLIVEFFGVMSYFRKASFVLFSLFSIPVPICILNHSIKNVYFRNGIRKIRFYYLIYYTKILTVTHTTNCTKCLRWMELIVHKTQRKFCHSYLWYNETLLLKGNLNRSDDKEEKHKRKMILSISFLECHNFMFWIINIYFCMLMTHSRNVRGRLGVRILTATDRRKNR